MRQMWLLALVSAGFLAVPLLGAAEDGRADPVSTETQARSAPVVYVDVRSATWRSRGRVSFAIAPTVRMKLASAGLVVTQDPAAERDVTLHVDYRESRGKQISMDIFGTEIVCHLRLEHPRQGALLSMSIREEPSYERLIEAPYVEVVTKLETNPYFYFLGELVRSRIEASLDQTEALIEALRRTVERGRQPRPATAQDTLESPAETFTDLGLHFAGQAQENAIDELGRLRDERAIDLLESLTLHPDPRIRLRAVYALGEFHGPSITQAMTRVVQMDSDTGVRAAAEAMLTRASTP